MQQTKRYPDGAGPLYAEVPREILEALRRAAFDRRTTKTAIIIAALERELADQLDVLRTHSERPSIPSAVAQPPETGGSR